MGGHLCRMGWSAVLPSVAPWGPSSGDHRVAGVEQNHPPPSAYPSTGGELNKESPTVQGSHSGAVQWDGSGAAHVAGQRASPGLGCVLQLIPLCGGVDGEAGRGGPVARRSCEVRGGLRFWLAAFWRQNRWRWSSFHRDPAKRAVLTLGDSPARCFFAPVAPTVVDAFLHGIPKQDSLAARHLPASSQAHRRVTRTSAKTGIGHNAKFCVLTRSRHGHPSLPAPPEAHIMRNSSHKHQFDIISRLGRCSARISCRSAAEHKNGVTITFYQLQISNRTQIGRDHNGTQNANYSLPQ